MAATLHIVFSLLQKKLKYYNYKILFYYLYY